MNPQEPVKESSALILSVSGMTCGGCADNVTRVLSKVLGASSAKVDLESGRATVAGSARPEDLIAAVEAAGYEAAISS